MRTHSPVLWTATAALLLGSLAGCGKDKDAPAGNDALTVTTPPSAAAAPELDLLKGKVFPIQAYILTPEKSKQINAAQDTMANKCLVRYGFPASVPTSNSATTAGTDDLNSKRYGITDPAEAVHLGYHVPAAQDGKAGQTPGTPESPELSLVLYGGSDPSGLSKGGKYKGQDVPPGGCMGEARHKLNTDKFESSDNGSLALTLDAAASKQAKADKRVVDKLGEWSACMKERGFDYRDPFEPLDGDTLKSSLALPAPEALEIRTAVADVECKRKVNLVGVWFTVEVAYENALIAKNQQGLDDIRQSIDLMLKTAATVA
jgi:hypothetical protein